MKENLIFDFEVNKEECSIRIRREFAAGVAMVWEAWTNPEILCKWWAPEPWKCVSKETDLREGGYWLYAMVSPEGDAHWGIRTYRTLIPHREFTGTDCFCDANGVINEAFPQAEIEFHFSAKGNHTLIESVTTYQSPEQLEAVIQMGMKEGMTMAAAQLDTLLEEMKMA